MTSEEYEAAISIHALARRATQNLNLTADTYKNFNPRSRKESDLLWKNWREFNGEFQSTLSQGERPPHSA